MIRLRIVAETGLRDKNTKEMLLCGSYLETEDLDRVNNLVSRGLCVIDNIATDEKSDEQSTGDSEEEIDFNETKVLLSVMKDALTAIGVDVRSNCGVVGVNKKLESLTEEQIQKLIEFLNEED